MRNELLILPISSLIEIAGILTLITNESFIGPVDMGFSVPYIASANIQGISLFAAGSALTFYALMQMKD